MKHKISPRAALTELAHLADVAQRAEIAPQVETISAGYVSDLCRSVYTPPKTEAGTFAAKALACHGLRAKAELSIDLHNGSYIGGNTPEEIISIAAAIMEYAASPANPANLSR